MVLYQLDAIKRIAWPSNPDGFYYWSSVYYLDRNDFTTENQMISYVQFQEEVCHRSNVKLWGIDFKNPPGRGNVFRQFRYTSGQDGAFPAVAEYNLVNVGRARVRAADGRYSYRYYRMPLGPADWIGDDLSPTAMTILTGAGQTFVNAGKTRNKYGSLYVSAVLDPKVRMWQLRHGTKRRERNPFV